MKTNLSESLGMLGDVLEQPKDKPQTWQDDINQKIDQQRAYESYSEQQLLIKVLFELREQTHLLTRLYDMLLSEVFPKVEIKEPEIDNIDFTEKIKAAILKNREATDE